MSNFAGDLANTQDALNYCVAVADKVSRSQVALQQVKHNSREIAKKGELGSAVTKAVFDLIAQNQKLTAMVAKDAQKKDELLNIVYAMLNTEHRITPQEVRQYDA